MTTMQRARRRDDRTQATSVRGPEQPSERVAARPVVGGLAFPIQRKTLVGNADDVEELEADRVARSIVSALQGGGAPDEGVDEDRHAHGPGCGHVRRSAAPGVIGLTGGEVDEESERVLRSASGGSTIESGLRGRLEGAFGADLSGVRLHAGPEAASLNRSMSAVAFTHGRDIFFRDGMPDTSSTSGLQLLAHELTHTVQQGTAPALPGPLEEGGVVRRLTPVTPGAVSAGVARSGVVRRYVSDEELVPVERRLAERLAGRSRTQQLAMQCVIDDELPGAQMVHYAPEDVEQYLVQSMLLFEPVLAMIEDPVKNLWGKTERELDGVLTRAGFKEHNYSGSSFGFTWVREFRGSQASVTLNYGGGIHDRASGGQVEDVAEPKDTYKKRMDANAAPGAVRQTPGEPSHGKKPFYYKFEWGGMVKPPIKVVDKTRYNDPRTQGWTVYQA